MLKAIGALKPAEQAALELRTLRRIARDMDKLESSMAELAKRSLYIDNGTLTRVRNAKIHMQTAGGSLMMNIIEGKKAA
jgi:hypothetical protein